MKNEKAWRGVHGVGLFLWACLASYAAHTPAASGSPHLCLMLCLYHSLSIMPVSKKW